MTRGGIWVHGQTGILFAGDAGKILAIDSRSWKDISRRNLMPGNASRQGLCTCLWDERPEGSRTRFGPYWVCYFPSLNKMHWHVEVCVLPVSAGKSRLPGRRDKNNHEHGQDEPLQGKIVEHTLKAGDDTGCYSPSACIVAHVRYHVRYRTGCIQK